MKKNEEVIKKKEGCVVSDEHLNRYLSLTKEALAIAKKAPTAHPEHTHIILDMVERYVHDAEFFQGKGDTVRAFAAINYAHGWLDCGAALKIFHVTDNHLFTVDEG